MRADETGHDPEPPAEAGPHDWDLAAAMLAQGAGVCNVARVLGCHRTTVWRRLQRSADFRQRIADLRADVLDEAGAAVDRLRQSVVEGIHREMALGNVRVLLWLADRLGVGSPDYLALDGLARPHPTPAARPPRADRTARTRAAGRSDRPGRPRGTPPPDRQDPADRDDRAYRPAGERSVPARPAAGTNRTAGTNGATGTNRAAGTNGATGTNRAAGADRAGRAADSATILTYPGTAPAAAGKGRRAPAAPPSPPATPDRAGTGHSAPAAGAPAGPAGPVDAPDRPHAGLAAPTPDPAAPAAPRPQPEAALERVLADMRRALGGPQAGLRDATAPGAVANAADCRNGPPFQSVEAQHAGCGEVASGLHGLQ